jgi:DNA-binding NarL/FixJ family response regulator
MRVILAGSAQARAALRAHVNGSLAIVGEFDTIAAARRAGLNADAILLATAEPGSADPVHDEALTPRERDVLELVAEGLPNRAIAERLGISDQTVKFHVAAVMAKLGAANRTDAVRRAARRGLLTL